MFVLSTCGHKETQTVAEVRYLRLQVPVNHSDVVHVTDGRHQLPHDAAGLRFAEMLLPADPLQQLPPTEQLQDQVGVELQHTHTHDYTS